MLLTEKIKQERRIKMILTLLWKFQFLLASDESGVPKKEPQKMICCFCRPEEVESHLCAAGTFNAKRNKANSSHVQSITQKWIEMAKMRGDQVLMVTYNKSTLSTTSNVEAEDMLYCTSEGVDQRVIRHVLNVSKTDNFANITVTTSDTDVLLLLLAFHPLFEELSRSNIFC